MKFLAVVLASFGLVHPAFAAGRQPNVLFILADDLGWSDTTLHGTTTFYQTPNVERLARRGVVFRQAYSASPLCSPTRSAILTGLSPARSGITSPNCHLPDVVLQATAGTKAAPDQKSIQPAPVTRLKTDYHTLSKSMKAAGYATGHFGKWHLGPEPYSALQQGFDVDVPHYPGPGPAGSYVAPWKFRDFDADPGEPNQHIEDRMAKEAVAFMEKHKDEPFYLNYWMFSVHAPFDAKKALIEKHRPRVNPAAAQRSPTYAAMVESMDDAIGTLLDTLERLGIADHTIIIFTSDNGGNMYNEIDGTTPMRVHSRFEDDSDSLPGFHPYQTGKHPTIEPANTTIEHPNAMNKLTSLALTTLLLWIAPGAACLRAAPAAAAGATYYTEEQVYTSRPNPSRDTPFGGIGVTGLMARIYPGVTVKVEQTMPGSPAAGKFKKGEIITGINGVSLKGLNPFVTLGNALTQAEASDGRMVFDVVSADGKAERKETVSIPVLGAYSKTWPLNCGKSEKIIGQAADFYADSKKFDEGGIPGALACLFLLSTGDDKDVPRVKAYFDAFPKDVDKIGQHTWNNGYNGIACGEYYLRTGDASVLPILQYYCDDAKERQKFGRGWTHWGTDVNPGYVAGGLMNPAGAQVLTTLLLGKECGVKVDEETLLGSLRFFYRFAGHGTVAYGDHRGEGGLGSNGKDGMIAAAMQIATGARGDVTIYQKARQYLAMSMIDSYPVLVMGHGDDGRGDGIWRGIVTSYLMQEKPALYRQAMDRLTWWHDLSREPGGSIGIATLAWNNGVIGSSGPGMGLSYTAPLHTLRITGAPRSKHAKDFTLPGNLWGTEADRAFLAIDHNPKYFDSGADEPAHMPFYALGGAYHQPEKDLNSLPRETLRKNIYHRNYMIRTQAAKALRAVGAFDDLEKLLRDPDPRVRRAALDGLTDYNYWFSIGRSPIPTEKFSPAMLEAITKMLADPAESWWVVDGALMALKFAPAKDIHARLPLILPWTTHSDWWLRESAFLALSGLEQDDTLYLGILPTLLTMASGEYHTQPRARMMNHLEGTLKRKTPASPAGKLIVAGLQKAIAASEIKPGERSSEGAYNVIQTVRACLQSEPTTAGFVAQAMQERFSEVSTGDLVALVAAPNANPEGRPYGLYTTLEQLPPQQREELTDILFRVYRQELIKRMNAEKGENPPLVDTIIDLTKLRNPDAGWKPLGKVAPVERIWRFTSFDPLTEKDRMHPREKRRFRDIQLPDELKGWQAPDYDDSKWRKGGAPIGVGDFKQGSVSFENQSDWGRGEFLVMRTTFEMDAVDCDSYRLRILARQGFRVYLNGHEIHTYGWWKDMPHYRPIVLNAGQIKHLKKGANVLAAYGNVEYDNKTQAPCGQMDLSIEGLKKSDLK